MPAWRSWLLCRRDRFNPPPDEDPAWTKRNGGPKAAVSFAESISLSSTVLVDLRLPPTALELGFVLLALRARRARESRQSRVLAQEVPAKKKPQFGGSASRGPLEPSLRARPSGDEGKGDAVAATRARATALRSGARRRTSLPAPARTRPR